MASARTNSAQEKIVRSEADRYDQGPLRQRGIDASPSFELEQERKTNRCLASDFPSSTAPSSHPAPIGRQKTRSSKFSAPCPVRTAGTQFCSQSIYVHCAMQSYANGRGGRRI